MVELLNTMFRTIIFKKMAVIVDKSKKLAILRMLAIDRVEEFEIPVISNQIAVIVIPEYKY